MVFLRMCDRLALTRTNIQVLEQKKTSTYRRTPDQTVFNPLFSKKRQLFSHCYIGGDRARSEPAGVSPFDRIFTCFRSGRQILKGYLEFWKILIFLFCLVGQISFFTLKNQMIGRAALFVYIKNLDVATSKISGFQARHKLYVKSPMIMVTFLVQPHLIYIFSVNISKRIVVSG